MNRIEFYNQDYKNIMKSGINQDVKKWSNLMLRREGLYKWELYSTIEYDYPIYRGAITHISHKVFYRHVINRYSDPSSRTPWKALHLTILKWSCVLECIPIYNNMILYYAMWCNDGFALDMVCKKDDNVSLGLFHKLGKNNEIFV